MEKALDSGAENRAQYKESYLVTEAAQEPEVNTEKGVGDFDLIQSLF